MDTPTLEREIARLESLNDQLETELGEVDRLLRLVGFSEGTSSAKSIATELLEGGIDPLDL